MPITPTYPGVYVAEIPSGVRTITGVSTSVTAFIGSAKRGPLNQAVHILSFGDYARRFGGLAADSEMSYAVRQFFLNGGSDAWVVRLAKNPSAASTKLQDGEAVAKDTLEITALDEGASANNIAVRVDYHSSQGNSLASAFNLTLNFTSPDNPIDSRSERFENLSMNSRDARYVEDLVNGASQLVTVKRLHDLAGLGKGNSTSGKLVDGNGNLLDVQTLFDPTHNQFRVVVNGLPPVTVILTQADVAGAAEADRLETMRAAIETKLTTAVPSTPALNTLKVTVSANNELVITSGAGGETSTADGEISSVRVLPGATNDISARLKLGTLNGGTETDAAAMLRPAEIPLAGTITTLAGGHEEVYTNNEAYALFIADRSERKGIYALEDVDTVNLLCLPGVTDAGILADADSYCKERRAFMIVDAPPNQKPADMVTLISGPTLPKTDSAAIYYPWIKIADPLKSGKLRTTAPSGTLAGLYARTDSTRGVWKAPAGTDATLGGAQGVEYMLTDGENGTLNPLGVDCVRSFPVFGVIAWGARTLRGANEMASEYKYIPVRRLALYIEESLYRGTKWAVFEPNDEPLWAQLRLNLGAFMHNLFRQGAFQGMTPAQAYFVKCDKETTTQNDINLGVVNILVGFAPLKPAEFVIIQIQQIAGQIQA